MKKIFIIMLILFITGCTSSYNINIGKDFVSENLMTIEEDTSKWNSKYSEISSLTLLEKFKYESNNEIFSNIDDFNYAQNHYYSSVDENLLYKINYIEDTTRIGYSYDYTFNIDKFSKSSLINYCMENVDITKIDDYYKISVTGNFECKYDMLEKLVVNVKSDYYTITNDNSSKHSFGTYTWDINLDGKNSIEFELHDYNERDKIRNIILISCISILFIGFITFLVLSKKIKNNNQI